MYGLFPLSSGELRGSLEGGYASALRSASGTVEINAVSGVVAKGGF